MQMNSIPVRPVGRPVDWAGFTALPAIQPRRRWYLPLKFAGEWLVVLVLAVPLSLVIGALAVMVKLTSSGPAFYRQRRVGLSGRVFTMIKLRTMVQDSEAGTGPVWSQPGDPRVTPIGRVLRDTHLDELPQVWNVFRGQMSLIGPRPERPEMVGRLVLSIPGYVDRLAVRPGLTGLAQVQLPPDSDDTSVRRKLAYDRYYVEELSFWLDVRIALSTCLYMFGAAIEAVRHALVRSYGRQIESVMAEHGLVISPAGESHRSARPTATAASASANSTAALLREQPEAIASV